MRKRLQLLFLLLISFSSFAQYPGNANDWTVVGQTYYKFAIEEDGIYRLTTADLTAAGIPASQLLGNDFQMFFNGEEVPLYVSTNGTFGSNDFIEFLGRRNTGKTDTPLYSDPVQQPNDEWSLFSDIGIHFLTFNSSNNNLRFTDLENDLTNLPEAESYFMDETRIQSKSLNDGYFRRYGVRVYSSEYDDAEGFNLFARVVNRKRYKFDTPYALNNNELLKLDISFVPFINKNYNSGQIITKFQGKTYQTDLEAIYKVNKLIKDLQIINLGETVNIDFENTSDFQIHIPYLSLTYPRQFIFSEETNHEIELNKQGSKYFELQDIAGIGEQLVLFDLSSNERITTTVENVTKIRTSNQSTSNHLYFDADIQVPTFDSSITFENVLTANNLKVIYNENLNSVIGGEDYIEKYINHKQSANGGNWNLQKIDIQQLTDQFAYGIKNHPIAIKNFVQELKQNGDLPSHILLIGKGYLYDNLLNNEYEDQYIPTYGNPGSDNLLTADYRSNQMNCAIGRIAASNAQELKHYIDKVIYYENLIAQTSPSDQTKDKLWMKRAMHLGGGSDGYQQQLFKNFLNQYEEIYESPNFGGDVTSFYKTSTDPIEVADNPSIEALINEGLSLINFFGHSSPTAFEFDLDNPSTYNNTGKYPFMLTNGCYVGNLFSAQETLSEEFVLDEKGVLTFMGPTQFGIAQGMNPFVKGFYKYFVEENYNGTIGEAIVDGLNGLSLNSDIQNLTKQQMVFHGDPTLKIYPHDKPDYLTTVEDVTFSPNNITSQTEEFTVSVLLSNIGKAINEDVKIRVTRILPNGQTEEQTKTLSQVYFQNSVDFTFVTNGLLNEGINQFNIEIDPENELDEITHTNNDILNSVSRVITSTNVQPILPYNYSIISSDDVELFAHTQQYTSGNRTFHFELDTTKLFNSNLLVTHQLEGNGGPLKWEPNTNFNEDTVYYWRVKAEGDENEWSYSSFLINNNLATGWNQSHYYQFKENEFENLTVSDNREFNFTSYNKNLTVSTSLSPETDDDNIYYAIDGFVYDKKRCRNTGNFIVAIIDGKTGLPMANEQVDDTYGLYRSLWCSVHITNAFYYSTTTPEYRKDFIDLFDQVDDGDYVLIYSSNAPNPTEYNWQQDQQQYGETIFDKLEEFGATGIRNLNDNAPYLFYFQKGNPEFEHRIEVLGEDTATTLYEDVLLPSTYAFGNMITNKIGPAASWDTFEWDLDATGSDNTTYTIIGLTQDGNETILFNEQTEAELSLSSISAQQYPYLKVKIHFEDGEDFTPAQLNYWRIIYETLPEMEIDISEVAMNYPLEVNRGENVEVTYQLNNISDKDMSEVLVRYTLTKANGDQVVEEKRYESLAAGESQSIEYIETTDNNDMVGTNLLYIDANPDNDQPEQQHFNNVALIEFKVGGDQINPYLDVTFDGIHIINGDLVSDTPNIIISLTDENEYLLLDNAEDFEILVKGVDDADYITYTSSSPEITFYPATSTDKNEAIIEFNPNFAVGVYDMIVQASDKSGNLSGDNKYKITFEVTDEDRITRVVNYPNPFTTRTEFVANIVGDAPDQILIQIFSADGKVVREIKTIPSQVTVSNGNNFYKLAEWDGTDTYGNAVGNGAYYYKVTLKRNGQIIEPESDDAYSKYFHKGIGKLYILR